jgi:hypothetical protein
VFPVVSVSVRLLRVCRREAVGEAGRPQLAVPYTGADLTNGETVRGEDLSDALEMVIAEFPRAYHQDHGRPGEEFSRAIQMFFEFALDFAKRSAGIKDHMNALPTP